MANAVKCYIDKFGGEVLIDDNHPLYIAQMQRNKAAAEAEAAVERAEKKAAEAAAKKAAEDAKKKP